MQIIGIYINNGDPRVLKGLKKGVWYPFGNFLDCHKLYHENPAEFDSDDSAIKKEINKNKEIINELYRLKEGNDKPSINLNCIVGKNGSGKSSLLNLEYRILNNLSCKIKELLEEYNKDYEPEWAYGFDAELYYELDDKIFVIIIENNKRFFFPKRDENNKAIKTFDKYPVRVMHNDQNMFYLETTEPLLETLGWFLFYTIGTNYTLFLNSYVTDDWAGEKEGWLQTLYHKNDGYFTPIVLVPYRADASVINTQKELKLANERVITLSILLKKEGETNFIEDYNPEEIKYQLINQTEYEESIKEKYLGFIIYSEKLSEDSSFEDIDKLFDLTTLIDRLKNKWEEKVNLLNPECEENIKQNAVTYLTYKIIKICRYYDAYIDIFDKEGLLYQYKNKTKREGCLTLLYLIIDRFFDETYLSYEEKDIQPKKKEKIKGINRSVDFTTLKIHQCLKFIESNNQNFYMDSTKCKEGIYTETIQNIIKSLINQTEESITGDISVYRGYIGAYDNVYINLLPPFFRKKYLYKLENLHSPNVDLTTLSSGEQQFLFSMSYVIYHMKNVASNQIFTNNRIRYRNINLVFDEAELYYHPEYQQKYIKKLLDIINRGNFSLVFNSINITIVTHSPFMLSDIPDSNILALKKGERDSRDLLQKTFCANYYDLLKNQFFLKSSIGGISETVINKIIDVYDLYNENIELLEKEDLTDEENAIIKKNRTIITEYSDKQVFYNQIIDFIGDDYLHKTLKNMHKLITNYEKLEREIINE